MTHTETLSSLCEAMTLSNFTQDTQKAYAHSIKKFLEYSRLKSERDLTPQIVRDYLLHLTKTHKLSYSTVKISCSAIRYLCLYVFNRPDIAVSIPKRKTPRTLPSILSKDEVFRVIKSGENLEHRTMLATIYGTGIRVSELLNLRVSDIKSDEGVVLVRQGKGQKDRITVLLDILLKQLRAYWKVHSTYILFISKSSRFKQAYEPYIIAHDIS